MKTQDEVDGLAQHWESLAWEVTEDGWELRYGGLHLIVYADGEFADDPPAECSWKVEWRDDEYTNYSASQEQAKRDAISWAIEFCQQTIAQLKRTDPRSKP